jgi:hypothetical protein
MASMKLDPDRPMASLREATGHNTSHFARLRGVAGPTQIQAENAGPDVGLRPLVNSAAAFGYAIVVRRGRAGGGPVVTDGQVPRVSVRSFLGVANSLGSAASLELLPLGPDDPKWMHALAAERVARQRAYEAERAAKAKAHAKRPPSQVTKRVRAAQKAAEGGDGDGLEARLANAKPRTAAAFRAMLDGTAAEVYDGRIKPRMAGKKAPSKAALGATLGITKQAVHEVETRLVEDLRWLGLAGPLSGTRAPATAGDGARS